MTFVLAVLTAAAAVLVYVSILTVRRGWRIHRPTSFEERQRAIQAHKTSATALALTAVVAAFVLPLFIEPVLRANLAPHSSALLRATHLVLIACFLALLALLRLPFTGRKNPALHRKLARIWIAIFLAVSTTGFMLFANVLKAFLK